jgi:hypothetical protein
MPHIVIEQFRERQLFQLIDEVQTGKDRVAFIPAIADGLPPSQAELYSAFVSATAKSGYRAYRLSENFENDVVVLEDEAGRPSLWVDRHLVQRKCREAFLEFINQYSNAPRLDAIGSSLHVDHAFNKARVTNAHDAIGDDVAIDGTRISAGYLRLFLIEGRINTGYGASIEKLRSAEGLEISGFRIASWMVLLKLCEVQKPVTDEDFLLATRKLDDVFGKFPFASDADFIDSLKTEMRLLRDRWAVVVGGKIRSYDKVEILLRNSTHQFQRVRLARLIHEYFGWKIFNIEGDDGFRDEIAVRINETNRFYIASYPPRVVFDPVVLNESSESRYRASDIMTDHDDQAIYTNLIAACSDEVAELIKSHEGWDRRVLSILSGTD